MGKFVALLNCIVLVLVFVCCSYLLVIIRGYGFYVFICALDGVKRTRYTQYATKAAGEVYLNPLSILSNCNAF